ncbi:MAG: NAD+ synthase [Candidatus Bathyarchaeia archaeon]
MLQLSSRLLSIDAEKTAIRITCILKFYVENVQASGVVVGMSGGLDSSVVTALSARALGERRVTGICLPEAETFNQKDVDDASRLASDLKINFHIVDISEALEALTRVLPIFDPQSLLEKGNLKARIRMTVLYYFANKLNSLVVGTSNKSEILTGYFTKYGDGASDLLPIGGLYKTQVYQLAHYLKIPEDIINKPPTAGLWPRQLDEEELGVKYETLDLILQGFEFGLSTDEIAKQLELPKSLVESIRTRKLRSEHKRLGPLTIT